VESLINFERVDVLNVNYDFNYNANLVSVNVAQPGEINDEEYTSIIDSLKINGLAVVNGFLIGEKLKTLIQYGHNIVKPDFQAGDALGISISVKVSASANEFSHPFLVSESATELAASPSIIKVVEGYLNHDAIVHHSLFQQSVPLVKSAVDWHVDTGSNKVLNGNKRFLDKRLRMIVYLSDVSGGGLSYLLNTRNAAQYFLGLPTGTLFPESAVPPLDGRKVTVHAPAGTVIFFDAHGLHRPEPPVDNRLVLNVWYARSDFSARLPPVLVSLANIKRSDIRNSRIFQNARRFSVAAPEVSMKDGKASIFNKLVKHIKKSIAWS